MIPIARGFARSIVRDDCGLAAEAILERVDVQSSAG
jgi:hypothetical protein